MTFRPGPGTKIPESRSFESWIVHRSVSCTKVAGYSLGHGFESRMGARSPDGLVGQLVCGSTLASQVWVRFPRDLFFLSPRQRATLARAISLSFLSLSQRATLPRAISLSLRVPPSLPPSSLPLSLAFSVHIAFARGSRGAPPHRGLDTKPHSLCMFITVGPIKKLRAGGGRGRREDMC